MPAWLWKRKKGKGSLLRMLVPGDVFGFVFKYTPHSRAAASTTRALDEERYVWLLFDILFEKQKSCVLL